MPQQHRGTAFDRYAALFRTARAKLPNPRRILSFGCSTGEELLIIRHYFPDAEILGCDVELAETHARDDLPGKVFFSTPGAVLADGPDAGSPRAQPLVAQREHRDMPQQHRGTAFDRYAALARAKLGRVAW